MASHASLPVRLRVAALGPADPDDSDGLEWPRWADPSQLGVGATVEVRATDTTRMPFPLSYLFAPLWFQTALLPPGIDATAGDAPLRLSEAAPLLTAQIVAAHRRAVVDAAALGASAHIRVRTHITADFTVATTFVTVAAATPTAVVFSAHVAPAPVDAETESVAVARSVAQRRPASYLAEPARFGAAPPQWSELQPPASAEHPMRPLPLLPRFALAREEGEVWLGGLEGLAAAATQSPSAADGRVLSIQLREALASAEAQRSRRTRAASAVFAELCPMKAGLVSVFLRSAARFVAGEFERQRHTSTETPATAATAATRRCFQAPAVLGRLASFLDASSLSSVARVSVGLRLAAIEAAAALRSPPSLASRQGPTHRELHTLALRCLSFVAVAGAPPTPTQAPTPAPPPGATAATATPTSGPVCPLGAVAALAGEAPASHTGPGNNADDAVAALFALCAMWGCGEPGCGAGLLWPGAASAETPDAPFFPSPSAARTASRAALLALWPTLATPSGALRPAFALALASCGPVVRSLLRPSLCVPPGAPAAVPWPSTPSHAPASGAQVVAALQPALAAVAGRVSAAAQLGRLLAPPWQPVGRRVAGRAADLVTAMLFSCAPSPPLNAPLLPGRAHATVLTLLLAARLPARPDALVVAREAVGADPKLATAERDKAGAAAVEALGLRCGEAWEPLVHYASTGTWWATMVRSVSRASANAEDAATRRDECRKGFFEDDVLAFAALAGKAPVAVLFETLRNGACLGVTRGIVARLVAVRGTSFECLEAVVEGCGWTVLDLMALPCDPLQGSSNEGRTTDLLALCLQRSALARHVRQKWFTPQKWSADTAAAMLPFLPVLRGHIAKLPRAKRVHARSGVLLGNVLFPVPQQAAPR